MELGKQAPNKVVQNTAQSIDELTQIGNAVLWFASRKRRIHAPGETTIQQRDFSVFSRTWPQQQEGVDGRQPRALPANGGAAFPAPAGRVVAGGAEARFAV